MLGQMVCFIFSYFWENALLFSTEAALIYITTNSTQRFPLLPILSKIVFCVLLMITFLIFVSWYLSVVLIYNSLMICNVEHIFMWLLAIHNFSLEKCVFSSRLSIGLFVFWCWVVWTLYVYFGYQLLTICKYFHLQQHSVCCLFILSKVSFAVQKLLSLIRSHLLTSAFISITLWGRFKKKNVAAIYVRVFYVFLLEFYNILPSI